MPLPAHVTLTGVNQGKIEGSCNLKGDREGTILVQAFAHRVFMPSDIQTGASTGKRIHEPLVFVKEFDKSSPKLYQALVSGEHLTEFEVKWYRMNPKGSEEHYFTTKLEDAVIVSIKPSMLNCLDPANGPFTHMEEISLRYRKIRWVWEPDGIESEDDWQVPRS